MEKRHRQWQPKTDLGRQSKDLVQEELQSKKARSSKIDLEEDQEDQFEEETDTESVFLKSPTDHNPDLKGNQNSLQQKDSVPTAPLTSFNPFLPQQEEL